MPQHFFDIGEHHWIGDAFETETWKRYTLFHIVRNSSGGSTSWPIAEIDIVPHPSMDGCNCHTEVTISIRNDICRVSGGIEVDKNATELRHVSDVVDEAVLEMVLGCLIDEGKVSLPYAVYTCMRHVEKFRVYGDFWNYD